MGSSRKHADLPNDTARWGWVVVLGLAKLLRPAGQFASRQHWRQVVGRFARYLDDYIRVGLLEEAPDLCDDCRSTRHYGDVRPGSLIFHDWHVHQREHAVRQAVYRQSLEADMSDASSDVLGDSSSDNSSRALSRVNGLGRSVEGGVGGDPLPAVEVWLARQRAAVVPGSTTHRDLARLVDQHGSEAVISAMGSLPTPLHDAAQYVYGARKLLNPIPGAPRRQPPKGAAHSQEEIDRVTALARGE